MSRTLGCFKLRSATRELICGCKIVLALDHLALYIWGMTAAHLSFLHKIAEVSTETSQFHLNLTQPKPKLFTLTEEALEIV